MILFAEKITNNKNQYDILHLNKFKITSTQSNTFNEDKNSIYINMLQKYQNKITVPYDNNTFIILPIAENITKYSYDNLMNIYYYMQQHPKIKINIFFSGANYEMSIIAIIENDNQLLFITACDEPKNLNLIVEQISEPFLKASINNHYGDIRVSTQNLYYNSNILQHTIESIPNSIIGILATPIYNEEKIIVSWDVQFIVRVISVYNNVEKVGLVYISINEIILNKGNMNILNKHSSSSNIMGGIKYNFTKDTIGEFSIISYEEETQDSLYEIFKKEFGI